MTQTKKRAIQQNKKDVKKDQLLELMESPYQLVVLLFIFIIIFSVVGFMQQQNSLMASAKKTRLGADANAPYNQTKHLISDYQSSVTTLFRDYFQMKNHNAWDDIAEPLDYEQNTKWLTRLKQTKESVLGLRVPLEYKDLHLNLVLALDWEGRAVQDLVALSQKVTGSQERVNLIKLAQEKLKTSEDFYNKVFGKYTWL